jgi:hypothetical protein
LNGILGGWRKPLDGELHNLFSSQDVISMTKCKGMRYTWHVAYIVENRNVYEILVGKVKEINHL